MRVLPSDLKRNAHHDFCFFYIKLGVNTSSVEMQYTFSVEEIQYTSSVEMQYTVPLV